MLILETIARGAMALAGYLIVGSAVCAGIIFGGLWFVDLL